MDELDQYVESKFAEANKEPLTEEQKYKIEADAQANVVFKTATENPTAIVKAEISKRASNLVTTDEKFKQKINRVSENTAQTAIDEVEGSNRKTNNTSYYNGREQAIESMGGDATTSKDKQKYMNWIYTAWWYVIMSTLGVFFIAPLKVLLNWALALSPAQTKVVETNGQKITETIKKTHWVAGIFAILFYIAYLVGLALIIYKISISIKN